MMIESSAHLKCEICRNPFNLSSREPLLISCCNATACKKCWEESFSLHEGRFSCPHKCVNQGPYEENPQDPRQNRYLRMQVEKNEPSEVECMEHSGEHVTLFNYDTKRYHCKKCEKPKIGDRIVNVTKDLVVSAAKKLFDYLKFH